MTKTTLRLPADLLKQAKHRAVDENRSLQNVLADALAHYLKAKPKDKGGK